MATDPFRALALECEDLPDDSLLRILSGEFNLDDLTVGITTRQIMGLMLSAPSMLGPVVYLAENVDLVNFRKGTLDAKANILEAAIPAACAALRNPTPGGIGNLTLGYGYESPGDLWGSDQSGSPVNRADEVGYTFDGTATPPTVWFPMTPGGSLPPMPAFTVEQAGQVTVGIWMRNCYNRALGQPGDFAQVSGTIIADTSPIRPITFGGVVGDVDADPTNVDLTAICIADPGLATELVIRRDSPSGTVVYTGTPAGPALVPLTCADVSEGSPVTYYFVFSRNGGADEIVLPGSVFPQNFSGSCNP